MFRECYASSPAQRPGLTLVTHTKCPDYFRKEEFTGTKHFFFHQVSCAPVHITAYIDLAEETRVKCEELRIEASMGPCDSAITFATPILIHCAHNAYLHIRIPINRSNHFHPFFFFFSDQLHSCHLIRRNTISLELPNKLSHTLSCNPPSAKIKLEFRIRLKPFDNAEHKKSKAEQQTMKCPSQVLTQAHMGNLKSYTVLRSQHLASRNINSELQ